MSSEGETVYCTSCGESIDADTRYCPHCGADQEPSQTATSEDSDSDESSTMDAIAKYSAWGFGIFFILGGLASFANSVLTGIITLAIGLFLLPPTRSRLENRIDYKFARWMVVLIALSGMVVAGATAPDSGGELASNTAGTNNPAAADTPEPEPTFAVRVVYGGSWSGAVSVTGGGSSETRSVSGSGTETIEITGSVSIVSANAQKQDDSLNELTVQILHNGEVVAESSTTAEYGVAQVSESF